VEVVNPFPTTETVLVELVVPAGWSCSPPAAQVDLAGRATGCLRFEVRSPAEGTWRRARIAADLRVGHRHFGQHAEALVDVR
jgi:hypothetical protein